MPNQAPAQYGGIISNLTDALRFLTDPQIGLATETSSFSMEDLVNNRVTVYLVIPTAKCRRRERGSGSCLRQPCTPLRNSSPDVSALSFPDR